MISSKLYKKLHGKKITIAGKIFELEFDKERNCFRLYQKKKTLGTKNIDLEIQTALETDLNHDIHYLERVNQPLPRHSYLLLDATTLQFIADKKKIKFSESETETLTELIRKEKCEAEALEAVKLDKKTVSKRVWHNSTNHYKTCIDNSRNLFIETVAEAEDGSLEAFKSYIVGKSHLRRKTKSPIPLPFWLGRKFAPLHQHDIKTEELLIAGADDTADALANSRTPHKSPNLAQSFALFPLFLLVVKGGISGLKAESRETVEELNKIEAKIDECQKIIEKFLQSETFEKEEALKCFKAIAELKESLDELPMAKVRSTSTSLAGYPGIILIFAAMASYQLQAILNLAPNVEGLNAGLGNLSIYNYDYSSDVGGFAIAGNAILMGGEAITALFIAAKIVNQIHDYAALHKEISKIGKSDKLSQLAKDIIVAIKKDEQFYNLTKIIGNGGMFLGQTLGFTPIPYAGLGVSIVGTITAVGAEMIKESRHSFDKKSTAVEESISDYYLRQLVDLVLENIRANTAEIDENFRAKYSKILRKKAFTSELFFHLTSSGLAVQKILKEGSKDGDFDKAAKAAKSHYKKHSHQEYLYRLVEIIEADSTLPLRDKMEKAKAMGDFAYELLRERLIMKLQISESEGVWIRELGEKLSEYEATHDPKLMSKITEIEGLPEQIIVALNKAFAANIFCITDLDNAQNTSYVTQYTKKALYENIIPAIQKGFLEYHLNKTKLRSVLNDIEGKTEAEREEELNKLFRESEASSVFTISGAQEIYDKENFLKFPSAKKEGKYDSTDDEQPIAIIGKVRKSGGGILKRSHKKNVYLLDAEEFREIGSKVMRDVFDAHKYLTRSLALRAIVTMKAAAIDHEEATLDFFEKTKSMTPNTNPNPQNAASLKIRYYGRETTV